MGSKTYAGYPSSPRVLGDVAVFVATEDGPRYQLPHIVKHSPTGFEWGYSGSGPDDLAYSILMDHLDHAELANALYREFAQYFLKNLPADKSWKITEHTVVLWVAQH